MAEEEPVPLPKVVKEEEKEIEETPEEEVAQMPRIVKEEPKEPEEETRSFQPILQPKEQEPVPLPKLIITEPREEQKPVPLPEIIITEPREEPKEQEPQFIRTIDVIGKEREEALAKERARIEAEREPDEVIRRDHLFGTERQLRKIEEGRYRGYYTRPDQVLPSFSPTGESIIYVQPAIKKAFGVRKISAETGEVGASFFIEELAPPPPEGRVIISIRDPEIERRRAARENRQETKRLAKGEAEFEAKRIKEGKIKIEDVVLTQKGAAKELGKILEKEAKEEAKKVKPTTKEEIQKELFRKQKIVETLEKQELAKIAEAKIKEPVFIEKDVDRIPPSSIIAAPKPEGKLEEMEDVLRRRAEELRRRQERGETITPEQIVLGLDVALGTVAVGTARFAKEIVTRPIQTLRQVTLAARRGVVGLVTGTGFPAIGQALRQTPGAITVGIVGAEVGLFAIGGPAIVKSGRVIQSIRTRLSPTFRGVDTTALGEEIIRRIPQVQRTGEFELGLIPPRKGRLEVDVKRFVRETVEDIPLKRTPVIPIVNKAQRQVLEAVAEEGAAVTGSFAQATLVRRGRGFADIDIVTKDISKVASNIKKRLGDTVEIRTVTITDSPLGKFDIKRVIDKKTGRVIADIDPLEFAEEGIAKQVPIVDVEGVRFVSPEARLEAKVTQLARGKKLEKVIKDIDILTGGTQQVGKRLESPLVRGAFGFTRGEQAAFVGKKGIVTTSARDLFRGFQREVTVAEEGLFATPAELGTRRALARVSRLGVEQRTATIGDIISGDITFKRTKPQIVVFEEQVIGQQFQPFGFPSSELEVILPGGKIVRKGKQVAVTLIEGKRVPIIQATIVEPTAETARLLAKRVLKAEEVARLRKRLKAETGFDISSQFTSRPRVPPSAVGIGVSRALAQPSFIQPRPPRVPSRPPSVPPSRPPSRPPTLPPSVPIGVPPSRPPFVPPSRPPSVPPSRPPFIPVSVPPSIPSSAVPSIAPSIPPSIPPSAPPSVPPSAPPSIPPSRPPSAPPTLPPSPPPVPPSTEPTSRITRFVTEEPRQGYDVYVKRKRFKKGKGSFRSRGFKKANEEPVSREAALGLGASAVDTFTNRSFFIEKTTKEIKVRRQDLINRWRALRRKFRSSKKKPNVIVERTQFAIDSFEEKQGIPFEAARLRKAGLLQTQINILNQQSNKKRQQQLSNVISSKQQQISFIESTKSKSNKGGSSIKFL